MANPYSSGTPDVWYSGTKADLWVEYKFLPRVPQTAIVKPSDPKTMLSVLQRNWINLRYEEGRAVAVIIGCPDGGVILRDQEWERDYNPQAFRDRLLPRRAVAQWITEVTMR
jgi:hypothetical protein